MDCVALQCLGFGADGSTTGLQVDAVGPGGFHPINLHDESSNAKDSRIKFRSELVFDEKKAGRLNSTLNKDL
jgi:hypothetical protein